MQQRYPKMWCFAPNKSTFLPHGRVCVSGPGQLYYPEHSISFAILKHSAHIFSSQPVGLAAKHIPATRKKRDIDTQSFLRQNSEETFHLRGENLVTW